MYISAEPTAALLNCKRPFLRSFRPFHCDLQQAPQRSS